MLKLHFSSKHYDGVKYCWKLKNPVDFTKRNDKYQFSKLARQPDPKGLLVANLSYDPKMWVGDLFAFPAQQRYQRWKKFQEAQTYCFKEELKLIDRGAFIAPLNSHPKLLKMLISEELSIGTISILNDFIRFTEVWDKYMEGDIVWKQYRLPILRYKPFAKYEKEKYQDIIKEWLTSQDFSTATTPN